MRRGDFEFVKIFQNSDWRSLNPFDMKRFVTSSKVKDDTRAPGKRLFGRLINVRGKPR